MVQFGKSTLNGCHSEPGFMGEESVFGGCPILARSLRGPALSAVEGVGFHKCRR
jgi:hypothetical protein